MESFYEWMRRLDEESREERAARERVAAERASRSDEYGARSREWSSRRPAAPVGSPEWIAHARQMPDSPTNEFREKVEQEIERMSGKSWRDGDIIDRINGGPKQEADDERVSQLIEDSYDDGTSPEETARMAVELMKSMGYL